MRKLIELIEAAADDSIAYWYSPSMGGRLVDNIGDHGRFVKNHPTEFGIPADVVDTMTTKEESNLVKRLVIRAVKPDELTDDMWNNPSITTIWERLALNRGWARMGSVGRRNPAYVEARDIKTVSLGLMMLNKQGGISDRAMVEVTDGKGSREYADLHGNTLDLALRGRLSPAVFHSAR